MNGIGGCGKLNDGATAGFFVAAGCADFDFGGSTAGVVGRTAFDPATSGRFADRISRNGPASVVAAAAAFGCVAGSACAGSGSARFDFAGFAPFGRLIADIGGKPLDIDDVVAGRTAAGFSSLCFDLPCFVATSGLPSALDACGASAAFGALVAVGNVTGTKRPASIVEREVAGVAPTSPEFWLEAGGVNVDFGAPSASETPSVSETPGGNIRIGAPSPGCGVAAVADEPTTIASLWYGT